MTGTDEHGEKIALAAAKRGLSPQDHCDGIVAEYKTLWKTVSCTLRRITQGGTCSPANLRAGGH